MLLDSRAMDSRYAPAVVEARWQEAWEAEGLYAAGAGARRDATYVICVPPPNVTGELHMGHALNGSIEDVLVRWHRMRGFDTLWQPGYDHAGIATQTVVEKDARAEGLTRQDLGREAFVARSGSGSSETGRTIMGQFRRLGRSLDYCARALHHGRRLRPRRSCVLRPAVGPRLDLPRQPHRQLVPVPPDRDLRPRGRARGDRTTRSTYVRYPFADGDGGRRLDRDCAAGDDPRGRRRRGPPGRHALPRRDRKDVFVPFIEQRVPVIADERVDPEFGTGALKVTPGHDPLDFEIGRDHGLPEPMAIGRDGRMSEGGGRPRRPHAGGGG